MEKENNKLSFRYVRSRAGKFEIHSLSTNISRDNRHFHLILGHISRFISRDPMRTILSSANDCGDQQMVV